MGIACKRLCRFFVCVIRLHRFNYFNEGEENGYRDFFIHGF